MFGFLNKRRLPAGKQPPIAAEERVVAWAGATGDDVVVVTNYGLWLPTATERIGWHEIHKATWSGRQLVLVAARELPASGDDYAVMEDLPGLPLTLLDPDKVPDQVRTRVNKSIAHTSHHPLKSAGFGVRIVARRVGGVDGLRWTVRYDEGVDAAAPGVAEETAMLVAQVRESVGPSADL